MPEDLGAPVLVLALALPALAGCIGGPPGSTGPTAGLSVTDRVGPDTLNVTLADGSGGIAGTVLDVDGRPIADAHVSLTGTDRRNVTIDDGSFLLGNLTPSTYEVHVRHRNHAPVTSNVTVEQGTFARAVVHMGSLDLDVYWSDRDGLPFVDRTTTFHDGDETNRALSASLSLYNHGCSEGSYLHGRAHRIDFPRNGTTTILPGTDEIRVSADWSEDAYGYDRLLVMFQPGNSWTWRFAGYVQKGDTVAVPVNASTWDYPGAETSSWGLALCQETNENGSLWPDPPPTGYRPRVFFGDIHVTVDLVRGTDAADTPSEEDAR